jgi:hypothetical protein
VVGAPQDAYGAVIRQEVGPTGQATGTLSVRREPQQRRGRTGLVDE